MASTAPVTATRLVYARAVLGRVFHAMRVSVTTRDGEWPDGRALCGADPMRWYTARGYVPLGGRICSACVRTLATDSRRRRQPA